ncbi:MAG: coenzyme F420-0:L-glutamate ligase [Holosporales bacterium]|jgi:putative folate metabolism gamma-glutamate ligase|nr:coenzyme F420-0:L-glutamate ligase [Holosporales bacterium]
MRVVPVKFPIVVPGSDLGPLLSSNLPPIGDDVILAVTSKIVSLSEFRIIAKKDVKNKSDLIRAESDFYIKTNSPMFITIKHGILIPSAGIDESNGNDFYILYPQEPFRSAERIWRLAKDIFNVDNLGVIITDSHTTPMRRGVTGIALSWCGFKPTRDYIGQRDIFKKKLRYTKVNNVDALAASAVFIMGEANEQTPLAIITEAPNIAFTQVPPTTEEINDFTIDLEEDLYSPLLNGANWVKGGVK